MIKEFKYPQPDSVENMQSTLANLHEIFDALTEGRIPNDSNYSSEDLKNFSESVMKTQKKRINQYFPEGSWCLMENEGAASAPSDAKVYFLDMPSYLLLSFLVYLKNNHSEIVKTLPGINEVIKKGLSFAAARDLHGHGFDSNDDMIRAIKVFHKGGVLQFVSENPNISPEFIKMLLSHLRGMENSIRENNTERFYGDYGPEFKEIIEILKIVEK